MTGEEKQRVKTIWLGYPVKPLEENFTPGQYTIHRIRTTEESEAPYTHTHTHTL